MDLEMMNLIGEGLLELEKIVGLVGNWKHNESLLRTLKFLAVILFLKFSWIFIFLSFFFFFSVLFFFGNSDRYASFNLFL